ncbi:MAG: hypothetical protein JSV99_00400 [Planctomycetota bacterium]|nr:MAG: hypothetical protein JSV99_00400 [Planctomycetota bacterium]
MEKLYLFIGRADKEGSGRDWQAEIGGGGENKSMGKAFAKGWWTGSAERKRGVPPGAGRAGGTLGSHRILSVVLLAFYFDFDGLCSLERGPILRKMALTLGQQGGKLFGGSESAEATFRRWGFPLINRDVAA